MKTRYLFVLTVIFVILALTLNTFAQDYTQWHLPEGAKARLGKGWISGDIAYSPDGRRLAVASSIGIWLYDAHTGTELNLLTGHEAPITGIAFSLDGQTVASGSLDNTVRLWDAVSGAHKSTLVGHEDRITSLAYFPNGTTLASGSWDKTVRLWDTVSGTHKATLVGHESIIRSIAYSPDGTTLASGGYNEVCLWDVSTGQLKNTITFLAGHVNVTFSPDGTTIASRSEVGKVELWDAATGILKNTLEATSDGAWGNLSTIVYSPDGTTIASAGNHVEGASSSRLGVRLWDAVSGELKVILVHGSSVDSIAFSPDGATLASASGHEIRSWDASTRQLKTTFIEHISSISGIAAYSPDGMTLATKSPDYKVSLWNAVTGQLKAVLEGHTESITSVVYNPDGQTLASGSDDKTIRLWDSDTGRHLRTLGGHTDYVNIISFSPDGSILASGSSDNTVRLWDAATGQLKAVLEGHTESVTSVVYNPDGTTLASGNGDPSILSRWARIHLWDAATGQLKAVLNDVISVFSIVYSPHGTTFTSTGVYREDFPWSNEFDWDALKGTVRLWDAATGEPKITLTGHISPVLSIAYNLDGTTLASGGYDKTIRLWDVNTGRHIRTLTRHTGSVWSVAFNPDGNTLASGSSDGTVLLWDLAPTSVASERITADINSDGVVNIIDLTLVASNFGKTGQNAADVNGDGVVNIIDLTLVAAAFGNMASAPEIGSSHLDSMPTRSDVEAWLREARQANLSDPAFQRGILILEQLLTALTPKATALLPNYPNPFNPETWIPYQLAAPADVSISIYAADGKLVRTLALGHQPVGIYESRNRAAYWDGKNALGESVASGVYFYTLTAGDFTATRKMLIQK